MSKFLDLDGLDYFAQKIKNSIQSIAQSNMATTTNTSITITGLDSLYNASCVLLCTDRRTSNAEDSIFMINRYQSTVRITKIVGSYTPTVTLSNDTVTVSGLKDYQSITILAARNLTLGNV